MEKSFAPRGGPNRRFPLSSQIHFRVEPLESRTLLAAAIEPVLDALKTPAAASYVPASKFLFKQGAFLTKRTAGAPLQLALDYLTNNAAALGLAPADVASPFVTDQYTDTDTGVTHIYLRQKFGGLPVANADMNITVMRDGRILSIGGSFIAGLGAQRAPAIAPTLSAASAVSKAAGNIGFPVSRAPVVIRNAQGGQRLTVLRATEASLDDIPAKLQFVPVPDGSVQLAWNVILRTPDGEHWYETNASAADGKMLFTNDYTEHAADYSASFNVYPRPLISPDSGPRQTINNPWDLTASPFGWQDTDGDAGGDSNNTSGNNVSAQDDTDGNNTGGTKPTGGTLNPDGTGSLSFNFPADHTQPPANSLNAAITNLYYWNNLLHDIHFRYGFTEQAGNFQKLNYTGLGLGNDAVNADAQDGSGTNNANFSTPADGSPPRMQMFIWNGVSPNRDSDFDSGVIIHEYGHGVSNRLTGGPANPNALSTIQSGGMGEGWSDWYAMMLLQTDGSLAARDDANPMGPYVIGEPLSGLGIRRFPYSFDKNVDPITLGLYNTSTEVHHTGEIWSTALWDLNWILINKFGFNANITNGYTAGAAGNILALKLVMDAMKIQPVNPSLLQARDAILSADTALTGGANQKEIWYAFARRGFGTSASTSSSSSSTIVEAFDMPVATSAAPLITHSAPFDTRRFDPISSIVLQFNEPMNTASFAVAADVASFTGPGGIDLKPLISGFAFSNGSKTLTINFPSQSADGTYTLTVGPGITAADNASQMDQDLDGSAGEASADQYLATVNLDARPGPAGGGYEASPYTFENINLVAGQPGVVSLLTTGDDVTASIPLSGANTFNFYGTTYNAANQLFVSDNGLITFGTANNAFANKMLTTTPPQAGISPLWDDWALDHDANDSVLYRFDTPNNRLIIEWSQVVSRGDGSAIFDTTNATFQAILTLNTGSNPGDIIFNYPDLSVGNPGSAYANGGSATVGIKGAGLQAYNNPLANRLMLSLFGWPNNPLADGEAIRITRNSVSGSTFIDADGDGIKDVGEAVLAGQTVYIDSNNNSTLDAGEISTVSDGSGNYTLTSAPTGGFIVRQVPPAGFVLTNPAVGNVALTSGQQISGIAFGNFPITYAGATRYILRLDPTGLKTQIFVDVDTTNPPTFTADKTIIPSLAFTGSATDNTLTVDQSNGNALPAGGVSFDGLGQSTDDVLEFVGSPSADVVAFSSATLTNGATINYSNVENVLITTGGGGDTLTINGAIATSPIINLGPGSDTLSIAAGSTGFLLAADGNVGGSNLTVNVAGSMSFAATQHLAALNLLAGGVATLTPAGSKRIRTSGISFTGNGTLDLNDGALIVDYTGSTPIAQIQAALNTGYANGAWNGTGLKSTVAANDPAAQHALGFAESADLFTAFPATFVGESNIDNETVLVRYARYGDANLDAIVNVNDFTRLAANFGLSGKRWSHGDFTFDTLVNVNDFTRLAANFGLSTAPAGAISGTKRPTDPPTLDDLLDLIAAQ